MKTCSVSGCDRQHVARGLCGAHYQRLRTKGRIERVNAPEGACLEWLLEHVKYDEEACLIWPFKANAGGYPLIWLDGKLQRAHRYMCELAHGPSPSSASHAAHTCGRGSNGCIAPNHLQWKTPSQNEDDKVTHGTSNRGERHGMAKLTAADANIIAQDGRHPKLLAKIFGCSETTIYDIRSGKSWSHLTGIKRKAA
jgi:hypothetical protein